MAISSYNGVVIFNAIRNETPSLANRFPEATKETLASIGYNIANSENANLKMDYLDGLMRLVSKVFVKTNTVNNPLSDMVAGGIYAAFGDLIENIKVHVAKSVSPKYLVENLGTGKTLDPFVQNEPEVETEFFQANLPFQYLVTVSDWQLARAFESEQGMNSLISAILESVSNGQNVDLYIAAKNIINAYINSNEHVLSEGQVVEVNDITDQASGKAFVLAIKDVLSAMQFPTDAFNPRKIMQTSTGARLKMYVRPTTINKLSTEVWASAFHRDDLDLTPVDGSGRIQIKSVDNFGGLQPKGANNEALQEVYDSLGIVVGYIDAAAVINGPAHKNSSGQWVVNITSAGTTADTTFPAYPDHWDDPNEDVIAVIAAEDAFKLGLRRQNYAPIANPRGGMYVNYWYNVEYWAMYSDLENVVIIKKHTT